jgi:hypothetical protein
VLSGHTLDHGLPLPRQTGGDAQQRDTGPFPDAAPAHQLTRTIRAYTTTLSE